MTRRIAHSFLENPAFAKWLQAVTTLTPTMTHVTPRRFRPGLDYTLATASEVPLLLLACGQGTQAPANEPSAPYEPTQPTQPSQPSQPQQDQCVSDANGNWVSSTGAAVSLSSISPKVRSTTPALG